MSCLEPLIKKFVVCIFNKESRSYVREDAFNIGVILCLKERRIIFFQKKMSLTFAPLKSKAFLINKGTKSKKNFLIFKTISFLIVSVIEISTLNFANFNLWKVSNKIWLQKQKKNLFSIILFGLIIARFKSIN